nr:hypothetical protein [Tanacetum cinerariifolium]
MSLEEIKEKFIPVWKQIEDFVPMASKEEGERFKRKGLSDEFSLPEELPSFSEERFPLLSQKDAPAEEVCTAVKVKPDLTNDNEDLGKLQPTAKIGIFIGYAPNKFRARTKFGSCTTLCTPTNKDLEILFQPMFDEYLELPRVDRRVSPTPAVLVPVNSASIPSSTAINQVAPSPSHLPSSLALQYQCLHQGIATESTLLDENPFAPVDNDPFINIFALEPTSVTSSFRESSSANSTYVTQTLHHLRK